MPLAEDRERYRVTLTTPRTVRVVEVSTSWLDYGAAAQATDGLGPGDALTVAVEQMGQYGLSAAIAATFTGQGA